MLCACSIFCFSAFCLCLPDNMDILPRGRALSRARSLLPERCRYPVEAAAQGGSEDAPARIGHARPLAGVDDAGAAFRPVPGVGGGQRAGSDCRQALHPWQPDPAYGVDVVLVRVHEGALGDRRLNHRPDRPLADVGEHAEHDLPAALEQAQDGRLVLVERAPAGSTPQPPAAARPPFFATAAGWPLWPATT